MALFPPDAILGYCTNVHAGANLAQTWENLERYALPVKRRFRPDGAMGVGLWFSAQAARELIETKTIGKMAAWLRDNGLLAFTLNGFPYGDFHQEVVKHQVYLPDWTQRQRIDYTLDLAMILAQLLPERAEGSISTLPIGWGQPTGEPIDAQLAASNLLETADQLARIEQETGRVIHLDLEPEPGCFMQRSTDVIDFFEQRLLSSPAGRQVLRHLRVCHDVCHGAVMFDDDAITRYHQAGIPIGKMQISSAVCVRLDDLHGADRTAAVEQLHTFQEKRYLHQTSIRMADGTIRFFEDLPKALAQSGELQGEWRVHFHVPIFASRLGLLGTSNQDIGPAVRQCVTPEQRPYPLRHFEVETYAWGVLPPALRAADLSEGIAREMSWVVAGE